MKTGIIISFLLISMQGSFMIMKGQDVDKDLSDAKSAYKSGKLDDARFSLQQALNDLNVIIGKEVLGILPTSLKNIQYDSKNDQVSGTGGGISGLNVSRKYGTKDTAHSASIMILSDSPFLTSLNAMLAMPMMMNSDPNQKQVKIQGYKGLLKKNTSNIRVSYELQIPFNNTLLTLTCSGYSNESDVTEMANTIPISKLDEMTK